jgi:uncharacterized repeat protein (TIGR03803 family)
MKYERQSINSATITRAAKTVAVALLCAAMTAGFAVPAHAFKVLVSLNGTNGKDMFGSVIQTSDGNIYGATVYGGTSNSGVVFRMTPHGKYTVLHSFCAQTNCTDGAYGEWLTLGADGNFYGVTYEGGAANQGTIYEVTRNGKFTTLYSFCAQANCTDGAMPQTGLVQLGDGSF